MRQNPIQFVNGMTQLPNGDLWKGAEIREERPDNVEAVVLPTDADDAIAQLMSAQKHQPHYECIWCGQQFGKKQLNELRGHIEKLHSSKFDSAEAKEAAIMNELNAAKQEAAALKTSKKEK